MIFKSIRWRLQAWHGLILIAVLTGFGVTAYRVAQVNELRAVDLELDRQLEFTLRPRPQDMQAPPAPGAMPFRPNPGMWREMLRKGVERAGQLDSGEKEAAYFVLWESNGAVLARSANAPPNVPPPGPGIAPPVGRWHPGGPPQLSAAVGRTRGSRREIVRGMPNGDSVLAGRSIESGQAAMRRLAVWLFVAGSGVLLLGLAGGGWLASRAIRPIENISVTAQQIAAGDLGRRINAADMDNELGRLAGVLNSTFARLDASFAQQARFTADASHELRTPVAVILSETQTSLARERDAPEYRASLEVCQRAAGRMKKLIESLLELSRLDAGQEPLRRELFDLAGVARDGVELIRTLAAERGLRIHCDLTPIQCLGDVGHIGQVVTNLLSNAMQFNRDGGEVCVTTRMVDGGALLTVSDTGEGIPEEDLPHIFERFYRADPSRTRAKGRSGLGLAICKAILDAHGGTIKAVSHLGSGSEFSILLPLA